MTSKIRRHTIEWDKIFPHPMSDKQPASRYIKNSQSSATVKKYEKWDQMEQTLSQRLIDDQKAYVKVFVIDYQNNSETLLHITNYC